MNRAYLMLSVKAVDEDERIIEGIATTPATDRVGDIVEPEGAEFQLPIPLLWQHDSRQPVGQVTSAKVSKNGITIRAKFARITEPGRLKDRLDEAWQSIKAGLVRGLSIGFKEIESARIADTYSYRYLKWLWLELSAVTIPANSEANIQTIKAIDEKHLAASGRNGGSRRLFDPPGVSGKRNSDPGKGKDMNISEQLQRLEASRAAKQARMEAILELTAKDGRSTDEAEQEEFDTLEQDIGAIDSDLKRLRALEKTKAAGARHVGERRQETDDEGNGGGGQRRASVSVKNTQKLEPGIRFARVARCIGLAKGNVFEASRYAEHIYKDDDAVVSFLKAQVPAATTGDAGWAGNLVPTEATPVMADFIDYLRPQTILGRFGTNGIPSLTRVPFRAPLIGQSSGGAAYWTGEGKAKKLTKFDFTRTTLTPLKIANIAVLTMEVLRDSSPSAEVLVRDQLAAALRATLDLDFIDPDNAGSANVQPASITDSIVAINSTGNDADAVRADIKAMFAAFIAANNPPMTGVWIMPATVALALSLMTNAFGQREFPNITMFGGTLEGLPVITSEFMPTVSAGSYVALVNARDVYLADEGGIEVAMSSEASLEMANDPTMDADTPTESTVVSMFQTNSVALRAERTINWARRRTSGVQLLDQVNWGAAA